MKVADKLKHHAERLYHEWGGWVGEWQVPPSTGVIIGKELGLRAELEQGCNNDSCSERCVLGMILFVKNQTEVTYWIFQ